MRLSLLFIFLSIFGFSQTKTHQFPKIPSSISVPISLPISEVQRLTNQSITGTLYEDQSYENNDNDQLKTKVEKDGEIMMKALTNNRLLFSVPLKIWAEKGIGTLGLYSYQETQFRVVMNFYFIRRISTKLASENHYFYRWFCVERKTRLRFWENKISFSQRHRKNSGETTKRFYRCN